MKCDYLLLPIFVISSSLSINNVLSLEAEAIIGAAPARDGRFKYQVSIQVHRKHICGGGIIGEEFVLTAAHCFIDEARRYVDLPYRVVAGRTDLTSGGGLEVSGDVVYTLARFAPPPYDNDIAVLKLTKGLGLNTNSNLSKLELPTQGHFYVGEKAMLVSYGYNEIRTKIDPRTHEIWDYSRINHQLRHAQVKIIDKDICNAGPSMHKMNANKQLCGRIVRDSHTEVRGTCRGDSGSPLVINNTIIGVLSTGATTCDDSEEATWYSKVSYFLRFISNAVKDANRRSIRFDEVRQS